MNYEIQKRDVAYQGRAFDVERLTVRLPDGKVRVYDLVQHNPSITVVPVTNEGSDFVCAPISDGRRGDFAGTTGRCIGERRGPL